MRRPIAFPAASSLARLGQTASPPRAGPAQARRPVRLATLLAALAFLLPAASFAGEPVIQVKLEGRIQQIPIERYVIGVLSKEIYPDWPIEALKAQAVASRTYALRRRGEARAQGRPYDVESSTEHQVFGGDAVEPDSPLRRAASETRGEGRCYEGKPIEAVFHSTCGGHTEDAGALWSRPLPYLRRVTCRWCTEAPNYFWTLELTQREFIEALRGAGVAGTRVSEIETLRRPGSSRVAALRLQTDTGSYEISAKELRRALGAGRLRSLAFELRLMGDSLKFLGSGAGHGVGLCQWGARGQALEGRTYEKILDTYYPGTTSCRLY